MYACFLREDLKRQGFQWELINVVEEEIKLIKDRYIIGNINRKKYFELNYSNIFLGSKLAVVNEAKHMRTLLKINWMGNLEIKTITERKLEMKYKILQKKKVQCKWHVI